MSTTASLPRRTVSCRTQILASASALVAAASVAVTLAVAGGGDGQYDRVAAVVEPPPRRSRAWRPSTGTTRPPVTARSRMACRTPPIASTTSAKSLQRGSEKGGPARARPFASRIGTRGAAGRPRGRVAGGPRCARGTRAGGHRPRGRGRHRQDRALARRDRNGQPSAGCTCSSPRPADPSPGPVARRARRSVGTAGRGAAGRTSRAPQRRALDVALLQDSRRTGAARSAGGRRRHAPARSQPPPRARTVLVAVDDIQWLDPCLGGGPALRVPPDRS